MRQWQCPPPLPSTSTLSPSAPPPAQKESRLKTRRTSGDMSVFTSGESAMDAVLSAEGGKML